MGTNGPRPYELPRALVRKSTAWSAPDGPRPQRLPHVHVVQGNFEDVESMRRACAGADRVFLVTNSTARTEQQQIAFTRVAQQSGVQHIVKLSQLGRVSDVHFTTLHIMLRLPAERGERASFLGFAPAVTSI